MATGRRGYSDAVGSVLLLFLSSALLVLLFAALGVGATWWALFGDKARKTVLTPVTMVVFVILACLTLLLLVADVINPVTLNL